MPECVHQRVDQRVILQHVGQFAAAGLKRHHAHHLKGTLEEQAAPLQHHHPQDFGVGPEAAPQLLQVLTMQMGPICRSGTGSPNQVDLVLVAAHYLQDFPGRQTQRIVGRSTC